MIKGSSECLSHANQTGLLPLIVKGVLAQGYLGWLLSPRACCYM